METVSEIAPEVDRLVLWANGRVKSEHGERLLGLARDRGLESLELIPQLAPFITGGRLTRDLAVVRMRYLPPEKVTGRIDELEASGLLHPTNGALGAGPGLAAVLEDMQAALAAVTREQWSAEAEAARRVSETAKRIGDAATADHVVAVVHRELHEPADPYLRLHQRLVTLRFVRQHDHAVAWQARGLTPEQAVALTDLWHGKAPEAGEAVEQLRQKGLVETEPTTRVSAQGSELRDEIEAETNRRNQDTFAMLPAAEAQDLLVSLRRLPGMVD